MTVTHHKQILGSTIGHTLTCNDQKVILYDDLVRGVHDGSLCNNYSSELLDCNEETHIMKKRYEGVWFMIYNGYLPWSCTIHPFKDSVTYDHIRFSEWLESMRKDTKCTIEILKRRFRCLKKGLRVCSLEVYGKVWLTRYALIISC